MPLLVLVPEPALEEEAPAQDGGVRDGVVLVEVEALVHDDDVHDDVVLVEVEALVLVYDDVPWLQALEPVCDSLLQLVLEPVHV
ncbi:MAG: hypothetical protein II109_01175 [Paludibacteraceae bacterium]|nr:hypothetical protein [Paludibacteraceae bacterium]